MKKASTILIVLLGIVVACDNEYDPKQFNSKFNGDFESGNSDPKFWTANNANGTYQTIWSNQYATSPTRSLSISTQKANFGEFASWSQRICGSSSGGIPAGMNVILTVKVKGNMTGPGARIAMAASWLHNTGQPLKVVTTQDQGEITGELDWTEYSVEMRSVPDQTECLYIYLILGRGTIGEVFFDDVKLLYY